MDGKMKRLFLSTVLGLFFGLLCAYMATIRKPIPITFWLLVATVYTRTLAGFFIGLLPQMKLFKEELRNALVRGAFIGFIVSLSMILPYVESYSILTLGFAVFGAIYGAVTDAVATKFS